MKNPITLVFLALVLCFTISCQDKAAMAELEAFRAQAEVEEQNKQVVRDFFRLWGAFDNEAVKVLLDPGLSYYTPSNATSPLSRDDTLDVNLAIQKAFPDVKRVIKELTAEGNKVTCRFVATATHTGDYQGITPTGNKVEVGNIAIFTIEDGKIVEYRDEYDGSGMMKQLGMELTPVKQKQSAIKPPPFLPTK